MCGLKQHQLATALGCRRVSCRGVLLEASQRGGDLGCRLDALSGILGQATADYPVQFRVALDGRVLFENRRYRLGSGTAAKGGSADRRFIEHGAEREEVASRVRAFASYLLRRHI